MFINFQSDIQSRIMTGNFFEKKLINEITKNLIILLSNFCE